MFLRGNEDSAPQIAYLSEIKFGRYPQGYLQGARMRQGCIKFPGHGQHALVAQMLEGEIHQAEISAFKQHSGGGDGGAVPLAADGEGFFEGGEAAAFEEPPYSLHPADFSKSLRHYRFLRRLLRLTFLSSMDLSSATGTLTCSMLSRSRTVTQLSLRVSWSTVMQ